jgi:predicted nucleic acid-binding protein
LIVVDASVLVSALVDDDASGRLARTRLQNERLVAPALIDLEVLSVLRRLEATGAVTPRRAELAAQDLFDLGMERVEHRDLIPEVWERRHNLTPYDAAYVALASILDLTLVTADARLASAPKLGCSVELLVGA